MSATRMFDGRWKISQPRVLVVVSLLFALAPLVVALSRHGPQTDLWALLGAFLAAAILWNVWLLVRSNAIAADAQLRSKPVAEPQADEGSSENERAAAGAVVARQLRRGSAERIVPSLVAMAHPDDRQSVSLALDRICAGKFDDELYVHRFGSEIGGYRPFRWTSIYDGRAGRWRALVTEVTEGECQESDAAVERGWQVLEQVHSAVITADTVGIITGWNRGAEQLLGYGSADVIGKPLEMLATPAERRLLHRRLLQPLNPRQPALNMVARLRHRYGGSVAVYMVGAPLRAADDEVSGVICCAHELARMGEAEQILNTSGERYRGLVESARDIIFTLSTDGHVTSFNPAFEAVTGWSRDEWLGRPLTNLVCPDDVGEFQQHLAALSRDETPPRFNVRLLSSFGAWLTTEVTAAPLHAEGKRIGAFGMVRDITERIHAEEALHESESRFRTVVEYAADPIFVHDRSGRLLDVNHVACESLGYDRDTLLGLNVRDIDMHCDEGPPAWYGLQSGHAITYETDYRRKDLSSFPVEVRLGLIELAGSQQVLALSRDITERKLAESRLDHLAHHDVLTGLPNRLLFHDRLNHAMVKANRGGTRLALCFLDLDHFKKVNDTLGHVVGDAVLQSFAKGLSESVREGDTVARLGGDEFVIILEEVAGEREAAAVARKILDRFAEPLQIDDQRLLIGTSIGISMYPESATDADTLLNHADTAMYVAKQQGPNNIHCYRGEPPSAAQEELGL